jgi:phi13 family phage major tail protein
MANIGLRNAKYNQIDYETNKYKALVDSKVPVLGKMIDAKLTENRSDASLFADDGLAEYDNSFTGGSIALTLADVDDDTYAEVKGCTISNSELTENEEDSSPEIGYGHIITKMVNGVKKYKVEFLPRIIVTKITADAKTKGESIEFNTVSLEGKVMALNKAINGLQVGDWHKVKTFDTLAAAVTYLDGLLTPVA